MPYVALKDFLHYKQGEEVPDAENHQNWIAEHLCAEKETAAPVAEAKPDKIVEDDLDVNNDGVVDDEDVSIMAKIVGKRGGRPKRKK